MKILTLITVILFFSACNSKKKETIILKEEPKTSIKLPINKDEDSIEGFYTALMDSNNPDDCKLTLQINKNVDGYSYSLKTTSRNVKGKANFLTSQSGEQYIVLKDIAWDEYEGGTSNEEDIITKEIEIPTGIDFLYNKDTLTIQNYGNSMNYYTKLGECGAKYIQLIKN
ncbi:hypothetical protein [Flavobacterium piscis]|uniref:Tfp pilus tip-associated adhesin PilY1 n=1 Tax=Flavobacterium piscis TaxID=1114874 RepID=A0ABU1YAF0_9FLAO|nr:hypothetical protein [Flavobacterium piscis]MDR7211221.1 Tfp pilus tip-associated adhesin PilY1 [Flavobacterium piscis]